MYPWVSSTLSSMTWKYIYLATLDLPRPLVPPVNNDERRRDRGDSVRRIRCTPGSLLPSHL